MVNEQPQEPMYFPSVIIAKKLYRREGKKSQKRFNSTGPRQGVTPTYLQ
jgi:hypothetical protein